MHSFIDCITKISGILEDYKGPFKHAKSRAWNMVAKSKYWFSSIHSVGCSCSDKFRAHPRYVKTTVWDLSESATCPLQKMSSPDLFFSNAHKQLYQRVPHGMSVSFNLDFNPASHIPLWLHTVWALGRFHACCFIFISLVASVPIF